MVTGSEIAAAAKGLAEPATKLVEAVRAGIGALYEPSYIQKKGAAENALLIARAHAEVEVADIRIRAFARHEALELRRQTNVENVARIAYENLPPQVSSDPVEPDWIASFFEYCKDVSSEEMQGLWARILAGEVARPGSFSTRTLAAVRVLSAGEARIFNNLALMSASIGEGWIIPLRSLTSDSLEVTELTYEGLMQLESAGLLHTNSTFGAGGLSMTLEINETLVLRDESRWTLVEPQGKKRQIEGIAVALTEVGSQLCSLATGDPRVASMHAIFDAMRGQGWTIERSV